MCTVDSKVFYEAGVVAAEVFNITSGRMRDRGCMCVRVGMYVRTCA